MGRKKNPYQEHAEKRGSRQFAPMRTDVLRSEAWAKTSAWGTRLIMDLAAQYRGNNNGDLCMTWSVMQKRGWKSQDTLGRVKKELLDKRWIVVTRKGGRKVPDLIALTFWAIDECGGKLDPHIIPKDKPMDSWKIGNTPPDIVEEQKKEKARRIKNSGTAVGATT